mmetsp:Transcript_42991/g.41358  ORF Transcript_42991/g.41358 Transcript_42991/m.41358 type:complete len:88 (-) Transcript_42991:337-600(-)
MMVCSDPMETGRVRLLEFFIYAPYQRFGHGRSLFDKMLQVEMKSPSEILIESTSYPLQRFMMKHYSFGNSTSMTSRQYEGNYYRDSS